MLDSETDKDHREDEGIKINSENKETVKIPHEDDWMLGELKPLVDKGTAQKDILSWMNSQQFSIRKRKENADWIKSLVAAVQDGDLVVLNGRTLEQKMRGDLGFSSLVYSERLLTQPFSDLCRSQKIAGDDSEGRFNACGAIMSGKTLAEIKKLEGEDRQLMKAISLFFL